MNTDLSIAITLATGGLGGLVARGFRLPGGTIMGAMIAVAAIHIAWEALLPLSSTFRTVAQILIGAVIGGTLKRSPLQALRAIALPALSVLTLLVGSAILLAISFNWASKLPIATAVFATMPGGASDMAAAALHFKADVGLIAAIHVIRQVVVFMIVVPIFAHRTRRSAERH